MLNKSVTIHVETDELDAAIEKVNQLIARLNEARSIIGSLPKDFGSKEEKRQTQAEMHRLIKAASNKNILRQQLELLAEYSRTSGVEQIPECSAAMASVYRELIRAERETKLPLLLFLCVCFHLLYGVSVKLVKLRRGK